MAAHVARNWYGGVSRRLCVCAAALVIVPHSAIADEPAAGPSPDAPPAVSFHRDVRPILQTHCQGCHQPAKPSGAYVITRFDAFVAGGESGSAAVTPGRPDASELVAQITPDADGAAPMPKDKPPLAAEQIETIRRWIAAGAVDDTPAAAETAIDAAHPPVYQTPPVVTSVDFSPDGKLLAVSGYHETLLLDSQTGAVAARLVGLSERIESAVFAPDGKRLAVTGGSPGRFGEVQIWDVADAAAAELMLSVPVTFDTVYGASWSGDGTRVAFGCADNTVRAIDATTGAQVFYQGSHNDWVLDTVFSADDSHLVSVSRDRSMRLNEVATQRFVDNVTSITPGALKGGLIAVDRHPQKDELLAGGADGAPKIYQMHRTQDRKIGDDYNLIRQFDPLPGRLFAVAYSPDGALIAAGSSNDGAGEARVYKTDDGQLVARFAVDAGPIYSLDFRSDGAELAVAGFDGQVRVYNPHNGELLRSFNAVPLAGELSARHTHPGPLPEGE